MSVLKFFRTRDGHTLPPAQPAAQTTAHKVSQEILADRLRAIQIAMYTALARGFVPNGFDYCISRGATLHVCVPDDAAVEGVPENAIFTNGRAAWFMVEGVRVQWPAGQLIDFDLGESA
jgi:hypothetical protein